MMVLQFQYLALDSDICVLVIRTGKSDFTVEGRGYDFYGEFLRVYFEGSGCGDCENMGFRCRESDSSACEYSQGSVRIQ